jgi:uncharacterized protein (TIGR02266 family)
VDRVKSVEELRVHARAILEIEVTLESDHNFWTGITHDISEGGIFLATYASPPRGTEVSLELRLPDVDAPFALHGVVLWVREAAAAGEGAPAGCGLRWTGLSEEARHAIARFVAERETIYFDTE